MPKLAELIANDVQGKVESPLFPNTYFCRYAGTLLAEHKRSDDSLIRRVLLPDAIFNRDDWDEYEGE